MSGRGRGDRSSTSGRGTRQRGSRSFAGENSQSQQPVRGMISGVGVGKERDKDSIRNADAGNVIFWISPFFSSFFF